MAQNLKIKLDIDANNSIKTLDGLENKLDELKKQIRTVDVGSKEFKKLSGEIKRTESQVKNLNKSFEGMDVDQVTGEFGRFTGGVTAAFTGIASLSGEANESMENMVKTVAKGMAIAEGFRGAAEAASAATRVWSTVQRVLGKVMQSSLGVIGLVTAAVGAIVAALLIYKNRMKEATQSNSEFLDSIEEVDKEMGEKFLKRIRTVSTTLKDEFVESVGDSSEALKIYQKELEKAEKKQISFWSWLRIVASGGRDIQGAINDITNGIEEINKATEEFVDTTTSFNIDNFIKEIGGASKDAVLSVKEAVEDFIENFDRANATLEDKEKFDTYLQYLDILEKRLLQFGETPINIDNLNLDTFMEEISVASKDALLNTKNVVETFINNFDRVNATLEDKEKFNTYIQYLDELEKRLLQFGETPIDTGLQDFIEKSIQEIDTFIDELPDDPLFDFMPENPDEEIEEFTNYVTSVQQAALNAYNQTTQGKIEIATNELNQLNELKEMGLISDEIYTARKIELEKQIQDAKKETAETTTKTLKQEKQQQRMLLGNIASSFNSLSNLMEEGSDEQRGFALAGIATNTAISIAEAVKDSQVLGFTPIEKAILFATTIAQILAGMAQAKSVLSQSYALGGILEGPSHAQGGVITQYGELEGGEAIINKAAMANDSLRNIASVVNTSTGGRDFSTGDGSIKLSPESVSMIVNGINSKKVYVSETDITEVQNRVKVYEDESDI